MRVIQWVDMLWARLFTKPWRPPTLTIFRADGNILAVAHKWNTYVYLDKPTEYHAWFQAALQVDDFSGMSTGCHIFDGETLRAVIFITVDWHPVFDCRDGRWLADVKLTMREVSK